MGAAGEAGEEQGGLGVCWCHGVVLSGVGGEEVGKGGVDSFVRGAVSFLVGVGTFWWGEGAEVSMEDLVLGLRISWGRE